MNQEKQTNQIKKLKCLEIRSKAILESDCLLDNGLWQHDCISCEYYVKKRSNN